MNVYIVALVIFLTSLLVFCVAGAITSRPEPPMIDPLEGCDCGCGDALPRAGRLDDGYLPGPPYAADHRYYGPFPADTGPLLILSEQAAAEVALQREIRVMIEQAEGKIPPRWRS